MNSQSTTSSLEKFLVRQTGSKSECRSAIHTSRGMVTKAFAFNSQARYRADGHFKEKTGPLCLTNQQIMVDDKGNHFQALFSDIIAGYQNPPLTADVAMVIRFGKSEKAHPSVGGRASLTLPSGAPLPVVGFHSRTTFKRRSITSLPVCTAFTSTIRPGACFRSCASPSLGENLILGIRTHITRGPTSGFILSSGYRQIQTGDRSWTMDVKASGLGVPS